MNIVIPIVLLILAGICLVYYFFADSIVSSYAGIIKKKVPKGSLFYYLDILGKSRSEFVLTTVILCIGGFAGGIVLNNIVLSFLLVIFIVLLRKKSITDKYKDRKAMIDEQVDTALQMIATLYDTTKDLILSIEKSAKCTASPMYDELMRTVQEYRAGKNISSALEDLAERTDNKDLNVFVKSVLISEKYGTNTAEVIEDISKEIRDRILLREEIKNEVKGQKLTTSVFLVALPLVTFSIIAFFDEARNIMTNTLYGKLLLDFVVSVNFAGYYMSGTQRVADEL